MAKKLVNLEILAREARAKMKEVRGMGGDLDVVADRLARGKNVKAKLHDGTQVWGKVTWINNAGFRGIEVSLTLKNGQRRFARLENVKMYAER